MIKPFSLRAFSFFLLLFVLLLSACKKLNEATLLGDSLVPEVDNVTTFETYFDTETDNILLNDTAKLTYTDPVALGYISSDPEFGQTNSALYFMIAPQTPGKYPFVSKDAVIDSVVLSLAFIRSYGDSINPQTVRVYEIANNADFMDTSSYAFTHAGLETTGSELGNATFSFSNLNDSVVIIRDDTTKIANQLRIRIDNALAERFKAYDTTNTANGGFRNDSVFHLLFKGLAVKADEGVGNGLGYFNLGTSGTTALNVYYHIPSGDSVKLYETAFIHDRRVIANRYVNGGQINSIKRMAAGNWASYLNNGVLNDDQLYIQSQPGSAAMVKIPSLDTFQNKLVHRAELIVSALSATEQLFKAPSQLFLDLYKAGTPDSAFVVQEYMPTSTSQGAYSLKGLGGVLEADYTYRFNITGAVQNVIADRQPNLPLRIYAPFDASGYGSNGINFIAVPVQAIPFPAYGRVILAGGAYGDASKKMRLRIIYSNL